jgi:hypothetical protein
VPSISVFSQKQKGIAVTKDKPEAAGNKRLTIDMPADLHRTIKVACAERGTVMADEIRRILQTEFSKKPGPVSG